MISQANLEGKPYVNLLLADDHALLREGLAAVISQMDEITKVIQQGSGADALACIANNELIDIVLLDYDLGDMDGIAVLDRIKSSRPEIPVIIVSSNPKEQFAARTIKAGASCYLAKENASEELIGAIRKAARRGIPGSIDKETGN